MDVVLIIDQTKIGPSQSNHIAPFSCLIYIRVGIALQGLELGMSMWLIRLGPNYG